MTIHKRTIAGLVVLFVAAILVAGTSGVFAEKKVPGPPKLPGTPEVQQQPSPTLPSKCKNPKGCYDGEKGGKK